MTSLYWIITIINYFTKRWQSKMQFSSLATADKCNRDDISIMRRKKSSMACHSFEQYMLFLHFFSSESSLFFLLCAFLKLFPTFRLTSFCVARMLSAVFFKMLFNEFQQKHCIFCGIRFVGNSIEDAVLLINECSTSWLNHWHNFVFLLDFFVRIEMTNQ